LYATLLADIDIAPKITLKLYVVLYLKESIKKI